MTLAVCKTLAADITVILMRVAQFALAVLGMTRRVMGFLMSVFMLKAAVTVFLVVMVAAIVFMGMLIMVVITAAMFLVGAVFVEFCM